MVFRARCRRRNRRRMNARFFFDILRCRSCISLRQRLGVNVRSNHAITSGRRPNLLRSKGDRCWFFGHYLALINRYVPLASTFPFSPVRLQFVTRCVLLCKSWENIPIHVATKDLGRHWELIGEPILTCFS